MLFLRRSRLAAISVATSVVAAALFAASVLTGPVSAEPATATASSGNDAVQTRIDHRYADPDVAEVPDFQRHVVPLLGRLGCNGRSCHGSFQGRGGFQLSLFGYDFAADHAALLDADAGRVDVDDVDESLILAKPSDADMHEGGKRFDADSWQARVLRKWIATGATGRGDSSESDAAGELVRLDIAPAEIRFAGDDDAPVQLSVIARWADGTAEDVTPLCRFSSNDDSVATIDENGLVSGDVAGDTHVVVFYDNAVQCVPVMRPVGDHRVRPTSDHPIDVLIAQKLDKLGIPQSPTCSDAEFIRRASLDVTGLLPTASEVTQFVADTDPGKRAALVNRLLQTPGYAHWWATKFSDWTGNNAEQLQNSLPVRNVAGKLWHAWVAKRIADDVPYDEIVAGIVTATARESDEDYQSYCEAMTQACRPGNEEQFAERSSMPFYWNRRDFQKPEERAIGFAYSFLGVRIECAQCHKHPFDRWSKDDFDQFAKLFSPIQASGRSVEPENRAAQQRMIEQITGGEKLRGGVLRRKVSEAARDGEVVPFGEILVNVRTPKTRRVKGKDGRKVVRTARVPTGRILGDDALELSTDPRGPLMDWLRDPENPYFAAAIVNRVWANYFGVGLVNPTDDMNLANPPSNEPLMKHLADAFIENDFDLRWLHRHITSSDAYARSADPVPGNENDRRHYSRHIPHRLPAEVIRDALMMALASDDKIEQLKSNLTRMAIGDVNVTSRRPEFGLTVFGKSTRESNCDCDRSDDPSLLQAVYVRNDVDVHRAIGGRDGWVAQRCRELDVSGPTATPGDRDAAMKKSMEAFKKRRDLFVKQVAKIKKMPANRRASQIKRLRTQYESVVEKAAGRGIELPPFRTVYANPDAFDKKTVAVPDAAGSNSRTTSLDDQAIRESVRQAYLRTLSRTPDVEELTIASEFLSQSPSASDGLASLMWTLVNTKEFVLSH